MVGTRTLYLSRPHGPIAVKRERNPARSPEYLLSGRNDFCVCRVLVGCALTTIESFDNLRTAKSYMNRIAERVLGSYVVFSKMSRRVLGKVVRHA
jgi:hypothetical protein